MSWDNEPPREGPDDRYFEEQARAAEDEGRAAASAEAEARAQAEAEPAVVLVPGMRVELQEPRGSLLHFNLGVLVSISRARTHHVKWDDGTDGWFSPAKALRSLRPATGEDALPRHVWIFDVPERQADGWTGPLPTLDEPVCANCRAVQSDENEFGPCKEKP